MTQQEGEEIRALTFLGHFLNLRKNTQKYPKTKQRIFLDGTKTCGYVATGDISCLAYVMDHKRNPKIFMYFYLRILVYSYLCSRICICVYLCIRICVRVFVFMLQQVISHAWRMWWITKGLPRAHFCIIGAGSYVFHRRSTTNYSISNSSKIVVK